MPHWEYKYITSGPHGFATPALLESHLNQLGKDEWEIIHYQPLPANPLAFNGVARRSTMRDWTLETAAAAAAKTEADKLRAEFAAKFQGGAAGTEGGDEKPATLATETAAAGDELRRLRDTERDHDPEALADEAAGDDWANLADSEDDLPTFFEAIKPHLRRNQRGPGQSVALDYLAKRWEQPEAELLGAIQECGFVVPEAEDSPPEYLEFDGDLHWLNRNARGQLFLNVREKPRPAFRVAAAKKLAPDDPAAAALAAEHAADLDGLQKQADERAARQAEQDARRAERAEAAAKREVAATADAPGGAPAADQAQSRGTLPAGEELLAQLRPLMRPNRRGPGWSGSTSFLARALHRPEAELVAALAASGLVANDNPGTKPGVTEIGAHVYWLNRDSRGGIWINGHERRDGPPPETGERRPDAAAPAGPGAAAPTADPGGAATAESNQAGAAATPVPSPLSPLGAVRLLLKPNKRGSGVSGEVSFLARTLGKDPEELLATLLGTGLTLPAGEDAKPAFVELGGEIFWLNENARDESLWLNAKAAKKLPARKSHRRGAS
jgi:hypothetical protein